MTTVLRSFDERHIDGDNYDDRDQDKQDEHNYRFKKRDKVKYYACNYEQTTVSIEFLLYSYPYM